MLDISFFTDLPDSTDYSKSVDFTMKFILVYMKKNRCECVNKTKTLYDTKVLPHNMPNSRREIFDVNNYKFIYELTIKYIPSILFQKSDLGVDFSGGQSRDSCLLQWYIKYSICCLRIAYSREERREKKAFLVSALSRSARY